MERQSTSVAARGQNGGEIQNGSHQGTMVFVGNFVHSTKDEPMVILTDTALGVTLDKIAFIEPAKELDRLKEKYKFTDSDVTYMNSSQFMMPGLIDTHVHAPQFQNLGIKMDLPLLEWLDNYTFPAEAKLSNDNFANYLYQIVVERMIRNGITTASYYASLHLSATKILADTIHAKGQRALVGKVSMLVNCPDYYKEPSLEVSLQENEEFIQYVQNLNTSLVQPCITPRFAPTCPEEQLKGLGLLAAKYNCHIQSHLDETKPEIAWVQELFPWSESYTDVYDKCNLLGPKTIMGHCNWMSDEEMETMKQLGVGVAHCPNSNFSLRSGICDVRRLLEYGVKVGLGTDCAGGYSPSILDSIRQAVQTSNTLSIQNEKNYQHLSVSEVFRLSTLGGAQVVAMEDKIGNFEPNKEFDALFIDVGVSDNAIDILEEDTLEERIQKFLFNGDDRNIVQVYVAGQKVHERQAT